MSTANDSGASSQADTTGQAQAATGTTSTDASQADTTSTTSTATTGSSDGKPSMTLEQALDELAKVRKEAASHRTKLNAFEKAQADAQAAQMTDLQRAEAKAAELQRAADDRTRELQEARIEMAVERTASKLGIIDPDAAVKLLDWSKLEYDDDGKPTNVDKLLEALVKARTWLVGNGQATSTAQARIGNTGRDTQVPGVVFKTSQLEDFEFYTKNEQAIKQAMREGRILKDN
ncbi:MAG TPA: phage scaffolding protein [Ktedonobacterales bacterium]|nr:phage scaffolding protein [Ktedonobacterales bacterium]